MSEYSAVLAQVKQWDMSMQYTLVQELLKTIYASAHFEEHSQETEGRRTQGERREEHNISWSYVDDMGLNAPSSWLTREECHEQ